MTKQYSVSEAKNVVEYNVSVYKRYCSSCDIFKFQQLRHTDTNCMPSTRDHHHLMVTASSYFDRLGHLSDGGLLEFVFRLVGTWRRRYSNNNITQ
jgi:hypothetical protein